VEQPRSLRTFARRVRMARSLAATSNAGYCPICEKMTLFVERGDWLRDEYVCVRCASIPRWRALIAVLSKEFPRWRSRVVHESSPAGPASDKLQSECARYSCSHFVPDASHEMLIDGVRYENLENMTLPSESIDLFVTQDVLEHVLRPDAALREIARVLRPGGAHVFTVPVFWGRPTIVRAEPDDEGGVRFLLPPDRHGDPIDPNGSLVVREWGDDLPSFIREHTRLDTVRYRMHDRWRGLDGAFLDVFVSRRPP
jgi:SAM-dependent methyltransferase